MSLLIMAALAAHSDRTADRQKADAIALVKAELKDANSAQFKGVKRMGDRGGFCGWVNAKNSFGGYTGFAVFYVSSAGKVAILTPELSEPQLC